MIASNGLKDWTNGTGVFPAGGTITVTAEPYRDGIYLQNQDTTAVTVNLPAVKAVDGTTTTAAIQLSKDALTGDGTGGVINSFVTGVVTNGAFTVVGTAGKAVCVLTF